MIGAWGASDPGSNPGGPILSLYAYIGELLGWFLMSDLERVVSADACRFRVSAWVGRRRVSEVLFLESGMSEEVSFVGVRAERVTFQAGPYKVHASVGVEIQGPSAVFGSRYVEHALVVYVKRP